MAQTKSQTLFSDQKQKSGLWVEIIPKNWAQNWMKTKQFDSKFLNKFIKVYKISTKTPNKSLIKSNTK